MRIGIDIDGVLYPWTQAVNMAVMERFWVDDPGPHQHWDWLQECLTPEQWAWVWSREGQAAAFGCLLLTYPGVVEVVNALTRDPANRVHFVTHRDPRRAGVQTALYLSGHFGDHPWAGLHVLQNGVPKWGLVDWDVFIDDKPETVLDMLEHTRAQVFAPQRPWNLGLADIDSPRFTHYADAAEICDALGVEL